MGGMFIEVAPKALIQAVKRNLRRFPKDFMVRLNKEESGVVQTVSCTGRKVTSQVAFCFFVGCGYNEVRRRPCQPGGRMRAFFLVPLGFFGIGFPVLADPPTGEVRAILEKAVQGQGGLDVLGRQGAVRGKVKGAFFNDSVQFTGDYHSQGSGKLRLTVNIKDQGKRLLVLNSGKGWLQIDGITQELEEKMLNRLKNSNYVDRVTGLATLLKDKGYTFTLAGDSKIDGKPAIGLKVTAAGKPDVHMYFDKASGLLVKTAHRAPEPGTDREVLQEMLYLDYQRVDTAPADEKILVAAGCKSDGAALLRYLRENIPAGPVKEHIQQLIGQLGDESFAVRQKASAALAGHGLKAAALLQQARKTTDIEVIRRVEKCWQRLAPDLAVAGAVVRLVAVRKPAGAAQGLLDFLPAAPDATIGQEVQDALLAVAHNKGQPDPALVQALTDAQPAKRQAAAAALGKDGGAYLKQAGRRLFVEGLRLPRRCVSYMDGQKRMAMDTLEREFFNRFEESLFDRPDKEPALR